MYFSRIKIELSKVSFLYYGKIAYQSGSESLEPYVECSLDSTSAGHELLALEHATHHAQGVVHRALHLVQHRVVRASGDNYLLLLIKKMNKGSLLADAYYFMNSLKRTSK